MQIASITLHTPVHDLVELLTLFLMQLGTRLIFKRVYLSDNLAYLVIHSAPVIFNQASVLKYMPITCRNSSPDRPAAQS